VTQRIRKLAAEIEKTRVRAVALLTKLEEMEQEKTQLENEEIIARVRSAEVSPMDFASFVEAFRAGILPAPAPQESHNREGDYEE
jgi:hypothetical protein